MKGLRIEVLREFAYFLCFDRVFLAIKFSSHSEIVEKEFSVLWYVCHQTNISSVGSSLCLLLGGVRCAPKRARIDAIWIELEHCVIELARVHGCFVQAVEIA